MPSTPEPRSPHRLPPNGSSQPKKSQGFEIWICSPFGVNRRIVGKAAASRNVSVRSRWASAVHLRGISMCPTDRPHLVPNQSTLHTRAFARSPDKVVCKNCEFVLSWLRLRCGLVVARITDLFALHQIETRARRPHLPKQLLVPLRFAGCRGHRESTGGTPGHRPPRGPTTRPLLERRPARVDSRFPTSHTVAPHRGARMRILIPSAWPVFPEGWTKVRRLRSFGPPEGSRRPPQPP